MRSRCCRLATAYSRDLSGRTRRRRSPRRLKDAQDEPSRRSREDARPAWLLYDARYRRSCASWHLLRRFLKECASPTPSRALRIRRAGFVASMEGRRRRRSGHRQVVREPDTPNRKLYLADIATLPELLRALPKAHSRVRHAVAERGCRTAAMSHAALSFSAPCGLPLRQLSDCGRMGFADCLLHAIPAVCGGGQNLGQGIRSPWMRCRCTLGTPCCTNRTIRVAPPSRLGKRRHRATSTRTEARMKRTEPQRADTAVQMTLKGRDIQEGSSLFLADGWARC